MAGLLLSVGAFVLALLLTRRSLANGLGVTLAVGYLYGILRARFPDGFSHFLFDSAVAGVYLGAFLRTSEAQHTAAQVRPKRWMAILIAWPALTVLITAFLPSQHVLIQLVGLRASVFLLPLLVLGARLTRDDFTIVSSWVMALNILAFTFAVFEFYLGVQPFFPENASTSIIYISHDVGEEQLHRIPATFSSAHAYAGTMWVTLPFLLFRWENRIGPGLLTAGVAVTSVLGIFLSAARAPVIQLGLSILLLLLFRRFNARTFVGLASIAAIVGYVVAANPRMRRFETLSDTEAVQERVSMSANLGLLDTIAEHPMGRGMGSAVGTSIPFFLQHLALPQIGFENEYARIALEQGVIGLCLWLVFILSLLARRTAAAAMLGPQTGAAMWHIVLTVWATAFVGTGTLTSIPFTMVVILYMGVIAAERADTLGDT